MLRFLFFLSGASGLIYQVVWVREFGNLFGNTIYSAALVVAVFMAGLGTGAWAAGGWADRRAAAGAAGLVRAYGLCELAIGAMGAAVWFSLSELHAVSALLSSYRQAEGGWHHLTAGSQLARLGVAALLLAPATFLMGATLPLLVRHTVRAELALAGWRIGALYAVNTFGAAAGALLTDYALIPAWGIRVAYFTAIGCNLAAAAGALHLAGRRGAAAEPALRPASGSPAPAAAGGSPSVRLTALALLLSGFAAMALELVWFRHIASLLGGFRSVFSLLLAVILAGIGLGALAGGALERRLGRPAPLFLASQALLVASALAALHGADARLLAESSGALLSGIFDADGWRRGAVEAWVNLRPILREAALPSVFMGFTFPLANALIQRTESAVGRRAGALYLANTAGAVAGSLAAGFLLLPLLGMQRSMLAIVAATLLSMLSLSLAAGGGRGRASVLAAAPVALLLLLWALLPAGRLAERTFLLPAGDTLLSLEEGLTEIVAVTEGAGGSRRLMTNGHPMSATNYQAQRYMRAFAHLPLLSMENPADVLVIAFGVGNTAHAASLHPSVRNLEVVDLSERILRHAGWFSAWNRDVLAAPVTSVFVNDGRLHLAMQRTARYDLITLEPPPIAYAGVASLYSREFLELARSRLKPGGCLTLWLPAHQVPGAVTLSMVRAFVEVFPESVLLSGAMQDLILMGTSGPRLLLDPALVTRKLDASPALREDLDRVDLGSVTELAGCFAASGPTLAAASARFPPLTDDRPVVEYAAASRFVHTLLPVHLFDVRGVADWCPECFEGGAAAGAAGDLPEYLGLLQQLYVHPRFLEFATFGIREDRPPLAAGAATERLLARYGYLAWVAENHFQ